MRATATERAAVAVFACALALACGCGKKPFERRTDDPPAVGTPPSPTPTAPPTVPPVMGAEQPTGPEGTMPPATTLPAGFADLAKTTQLEIKDEWNGMGQTHDLVAVLKRAPGARSFEVDAKVASYPGSLHESLRDPTDPQDHGKSHGEFQTKHATVDAALVEAFLSEVATRQIDPKQDYPTGRMWTDDYPRGHVIVWVPDVRDPIHLAFRDQQRHWRVNGAFITLDAEPSARDVLKPLGGDHKKINEPYHRMLEAMGLPTWIKEVHAAPRPRRGR